MQVIKLTPQQPNIKGILNDDRVLILCDTSASGFTVLVPLASGSVIREIIIKNVGVNNLNLIFDYNSQLFTLSGNVIGKTILPEECINIVNDNILSLWYQTNIHT